MSTWPPGCAIVWLLPDQKWSLSTWWSALHQSLHWNMTSGDKWRQVKSPLTRRQVNYSLLRHFKDILNYWIGYRHWLMSSHSLPPVDFNKWRVVIHFLTSLPSTTNQSVLFHASTASLCVSWQTHRRSRARPTPGRWASAVCRTPVACSTRSGRCLRWNRTRGRSVCGTGNQTQSDVN